MDLLPDEILVNHIFKLFWLEYSSPNWHFEYHPFLCASLVSRRFLRLCCRYFLPYRGRVYLERFCLHRLSAIERWHRKCFKWSWISRVVPGPINTEEPEMQEVKAKLTPGRGKPGYLFASISSYQGLFSTLTHIVFSRNVSHFQLVCGTHSIVVEGFNWLAGTHVALWPKYYGFPLRLITYHECHIFCKPADSSLSEPLNLTFLGHNAHPDEFSMNTRVVAASDPLTIIILADGVCTQRMSSRSARAIKCALANENHHFPLHYPSSYLRKLQSIEDEYDQGVISYAYDIPNDEEPQ
jgi:hypothetical protein